MTQNHLTSYVDAPLYKLHLEFIVEKSQVHHNHTCLDTRAVLEHVITVKFK